MTDRAAHPGLQLALTWFALGPMATGVHADFEARATVERPIAARNDEDATAAGLEVNLENRGIALETISEALLEVPGAHSVVGGAYGAFSSLSLRGSQFGHTVWLLGDVPLNTPDSGAFDMSTLPPSLVSSLQVYRGGAPLWLSQGAIGGVVRIMPARARGTYGSASVGLGSFGRRELRATSQVFGPEFEFYGGITATYADNDFTYVDDGLLFDDGADDTRRRIRNGQITDGSGLIHMRAAAGGGHIDLIAMGLERVGGVPGTGGAYNTRYTHRNYERGFTALAYTREGFGDDRRRDYRLQLSGSVRAERNRFQDPLQELGLGAGSRDTRSSWLRSTLRSAGSHRFLPWLEASLVGSYANDSYSQQDRFRSIEVPTSRRDTGALGGELRVMGRLLGMRSELRGSARAELSQARVQALVLADAAEGHDRDYLSPTLRLAGVVEPVAGLAVRASWADGTRLPSIQELFGDGGFLRGNARDLRPEHGQSADVGVVVSGRSGPVSGSVEAGVFIQQLQDVIVWRNTSQFEFIAENQEAATIRGAELGLSGQLGNHFGIAGAATFLEARNDTLGTQLPRRPRAAVYVRPSVSLPVPAGPLETLRLFSTLDYQSTFFHDRANLRLQADRTLWGAGGSLSAYGERVTLLLRATNLLDVQTQDLFQFPLPGRAYSALVTYRQAYR